MNHVLSSSHTSVWVRLGLFNAKIRNEKCRFIHRLVYQINEQDLFCHSIQNVSLILVTSLLDGGLKWVNFDVITVEKQVLVNCVLVAYVASHSTLIVLCSRKVSTL